MPLFVRGRVRYRVLIPDVPGNALTNIHGFTEPGGKECFATGLLGKAMEHLRIPVGIFRVEDANRVNHGIRLFRHLQHAVQTGLARVIAAIADDDQNFLFAGAFLQSLECLDDGVVWTKARAPAVTSASFLRMLPL